MDQRSYPPPPPPPPAATPRTGKSAPKQTVEGSVKDTIEAILVAFMLAFIFRAFVVEAFVIPTGSMAPTLLGAHMRFRCSDCGYQFDVNYSGEGRPEEPTIDAVAKDRRYAIFCPNCGYRMPRENAADPRNDAWEPETRYGDRILVLKFLYLFQEANRWDVVVFKSPVDPGKDDYTVNYIKRLVGRPNENILLLDGDVYVSTGKGDDINEYQVQTKPQSVQKSLWRIVHDNDFHPRGAMRAELRGSGDHVFSDPPWEQPWKALPGGNGWVVDGTQGDPREFAFSNLSGAGAIQFDARANPRKFPLTDWLAYDVTEDQRSTTIRDTFDMNPNEPENNVSDLMLEFFYDRKEGDGPLSVYLTKLGKIFRAEISRDTLSLYLGDDRLGEPVPLPRHSGPRRIEMSNVDYRVSVRVDGEELIATTPEQYKPDVASLLNTFSSGWHAPKPEIRISADKQRSTLSHVRLWRDIYYLNRSRNPTLWATPADFPTRVARLGPDEYFVLGDNSYVSLDARYWSEPINLKHEDLNVAPGRVPRRFMLGKAFFVYWPAGYRPIDSAPALVPNFGDMRFIH